MLEMVTVDNDEQLVKLVRQYKRLRTYPDARDTHQRDLHARFEALHARGLVQLLGRDANTYLWSA